MLPPNVHHLELFYYVAKHRGITPAVRHMPYGIQQPAVSGQMLQLEREMGAKLFHRRPFALTPAGSQLYDFVAPFFSGLPEIAAKLRGESDAHLRLAASGTLLARHIPDVLSAIREQTPELRLTLKELRRSELEPELAAGEIDIAIVVLHGKLPASIKVIELVRFPMVLLAPQNSTKRSFGALVKAESGSISEPLVAMPPDDALNRLFQEELKERGVTWAPRVEVSSLDLVASYVERGYGYGLTVDAPGIPAPVGLRKIPLKGFPPMRLGLLFQGELKPVAERFALAAAKQAKALKKQQ